MRWDTTGACSISATSSRGSPGPDHTASANNEWSLGESKQLGRLGDQFRIRLGRQPRLPRRQNLYQPLSPQNIHRHFELNRFGDPGCQLRERFAHQRRGLGYMLDTCRPFDQTLNQTELIGDLVQQAVPFADRGRGNLPGQHQHRRIAAVRGGNRGSGVQQPGTRYYRKYTNPTGRLRVAKRHVTAACS